MKKHSVFPSPTIPPSPQEMREIRAERRRLIIGFWAMLSFSASGLLTAIGVEVRPSFTLVMPLALVALVLCMLPWPKGTFVAPDEPPGEQPRKPSHPLNQGPSTYP